MLGERGVLKTVRHYCFDTDCNAMVCVYRNRSDVVVTVGQIGVLIAEWPELPLARNGPCN